jgi:hypothetical protein
MSYFLPNPTVAQLNTLKTQLKRLTRCIIHANNADKNKFKLTEIQDTACQVLFDKDSFNQAKNHAPKEAQADFDFTSQATRDFCLSVYGHSYSYTGALSLFNQTAHVLQLSTEEQSQAIREGWDIFYINSDMDEPSIQCDDELDILDDDNAVWSFIIQNALSGNALHLKALCIIREKNREEYDIFVDQDNNYLISNALLFQRIVNNKAIDQAITEYAHKTPETPWGVIDIIDTVSKLANIDLSTDDAHMDFIGTLLTYFNSTQSKRVPTPAITNSPIHASVYSDDQTVEFTIDVQQYFVDTLAGYQLHVDLDALNGCDFGGDYPADNVAEYFHDSTTKDLFDYVALKNKHNSENIGFECHINKNDVLKWLIANAPDHLRYVEGHDIPVFTRTPADADNETQMGIIAHCLDTIRKTNSFPSQYTHYLEDNEGNNASTLYPWNDMFSVLLTSDIIRLSEALAQWANKP